MAQVAATTYDVFVSYRHVEPDRSWVRGVLVRRLREAGLVVCLDVDSFRPGASLVAEMARAVEFSTVTVAVVTGARQEGAFAQLETIMVERLGADEGASRLIVMARAPGLTTFGLRPRLWLDVTDDGTLDAAIGTVVRECRHGA